MILIVGLGNPGPEYVLTRHNVGWMLLERFIKMSGLPAPWSSEACAGALSEGVFKGKEVRVLFPHTYMNHSGSAVVKCLGKESKSATTIIVIHDDMALPIGMLRVSFNRGAGGHNGVQSIIDSLGNTKFVRIRIGIAHKNLFGTVRRLSGDALSKFVLAPFTKRDLTEIERCESDSMRALTLCITEGVERAMQECNQ